MKQVHSHTLKIGFLIVLLFSCCNPKKVKTEKTETKDSLTFYINAIKHKNNTNNTVLKLSNLGLSFSKNATDSITFMQSKFLSQGELKQYKSGLNTIKKYFQIAKKLKSDNQIAYANAYSAYYYLQLYKKDSALYYYNIAQKQYSQLKDTSMTVHCLQKKSSIQNDFGDYSTSEQSSVRALQLIGNNNSLDKRSLYNNLAVTSQDQHNYLEAIYWYNKALSEAKTNSDSIGYIQNKSLAYRDLHNYNKAIFIFDSLLQYPIKNGIRKARILDNLGYTKWLQNPKNSSVIPTLKKAEKLRIKNKDREGLNASYAHLSDVYELIHLKTSHAYAIKMYVLAKELKSPEDKLEALQKLIKTSKSRKKLKKYYTDYIRINNRLKKIKKQQKHSYAKLKFDTEKNRADNLKLTITNTLQDLEMAHKKTTNTYIYSSMGLLLFSILGFSFYKRKKNEQEKREEIYKTETRISKKLHDEVANDIVHIMNKIQYTDQKKEAFLDDLQKIYLLTRNISHQNSHIITGKQFEKALKNMLDSFSSPNRKIILKNITKSDLKSLKKDIQRQLFRVLQELMVNMQKHSQATLVVLRFEKLGTHYTIYYADNGRGTNLKILKNKNGISNMESRIKDIHGTITFESEIEKGFKSIINF